MTHGDKAKAKADKSNKASVKKAGGQGGENGKSKAGSPGKAVAKIEKASAQVGKAGLKGKAGEGNKAGEGSKGGEKAAAAKKGGSSAKDSSGREPKAKSSAAPAETAGGFTNPAISAAFRQAVKKYPNALRKLTD